ncbi:leucine-rich repeat-containing protein 20 isoform X1 [Drosophila mauritiana]|uniref:Leucine-rich repeat-containing protein 20 isoform X1 n=1 Tax=Drosophila mauritiana TaxID=7226 RepID=A0A6P8L805_DROMA|nr:leucine-rich repeat-containing protein 20 isoform X1 [Drosophila mauritiana]
MRPFGNDITNIPNGGNNGGNNGSNNGNNDPNDGNDNRNTNISSEDPSEESGLSDDPSIPPHIARIGGIVTCPPIAGQGVIRVVQRCEDAKENHKLDLSSCELMQIPDAVYHLMRNTELITCNLSGNVLKSVSPKFSQKFSTITDLNLSHNKLSRLPEEFASLSALTKLNISNNSFIVLPQVVFKLQSLASLDAQNNAILEIDTDEAITSDNLALVDLRNNPLSRNCRRKLQNFKTPFLLEISKDVDDDW